MSDEHEMVRSLRARVRQYEAAAERFLATAPAEERARWVEDRRTFAAELVRLADALSGVRTAAGTVVDALNALTPGGAVQAAGAVGAMKDQAQAYTRDAKAVAAQAEQTIRRLGARYPWLLKLLPLEVVPPLPLSDTQR
jgi:hypothetical protein